MTDMLSRATAAASNVWHECETCPGEMYVKEVRIVAQAALLAALDPEDLKLYGDLCGARERAISAAHENGPPMNTPTAIAHVIDAVFVTLRERTQGGQQP